MVDKSEKFRWLVRLGFAARGVVYLLIGYLFLSGGRGAPEGGGGPESAFDWLQEIPGGTPVLYLTALGLLGYALYRGASALFDIENYGSDGRAIAQRIGHGASALGHVAMAYTALQFAGQDEAGGGGAGSEAAETLLSVPFGDVLLGLLGVGFLAAAASQAKKAYTGHFMRRISPRAPSMVAPVGRAGYAARAVVYVVIGWSLIRSAWIEDGGTIKNVGGAIASLQGDGPWLPLVAGGVLLFGVFSLIAARYRVIPEMHFSRTSAGLRA